VPYFTNCIHTLILCISIKVFRNIQPGVPKTIPNVDLDGVDKTLLTTLMPFQVEGVKFGVSRNGRCLIGDDMGLGKSIQALGIAHYYRADWPLLIVCPSSVRYVLNQHYNNSQLVIYMIILIVNNNLNSTLEKRKKL